MALTNPLRQHSLATPTKQPPPMAVLTRPEPANSPLRYVIFLGAIVLVTVLAILAMNIEMSTTSYQITRLEIQSQRLTEQKQALIEREEQLATPQELDRRARELGMVPSAHPAYIDLATGTVIGADGEGVSAVTTSDTSTSQIPPAHIYRDVSTYYGMGNEGV